MKTLRYLRNSALFCFIAVWSAEAQTKDSLKAIEEAVLARPESDIVLLGKTRDALRESIFSRDFDRVSSLATFLTSRFDTSRFVTLWPREEMLVRYWTGSYDALLAVSRLPEHWFDYRGKIVPPQDLLLPDIVKATRSAMAIFEERIRGAELRTRDRDFLILFLHFLLGSETEGEDAQKAFRRAINDKADIVLTSHRDSEHNPFIRSNIRYVVRPSDWGGGFMFGLGPGYLGGGLSQNFADPFMINMVFEGVYKSYYAQFGLDIGVADVRRAFVDSKGQTWGRDLKVNYLNVFLGVGTLQEIGPVYCSPFVGIGYVDISPTEQERNRTGSDISLGSSALVVGANIDVPISSSSFVFSFFESGYWYLRVRPFWTQTMTSDPFVKGSMWGISLGIGSFARPLVRDF